MFSPNERVVYPGHGVARINDIVEKNLNGALVSFYELSILSQGTTILVPMFNAHHVGIRSLSSDDTIESAFKAIKQPVRTPYHHEFSASSWNKRKKRYQMQLRKGGLLELCDLYRDLRFMKTQKELSFGENALLQKTESLLAEEISIVQKRSEQATILKIRSLCSQC